MNTIAFTGHRPKDLPGVTYMMFRDALDTLVKGRRDINFICGGALGTDTWAAEFALSHHIPYALALPFPRAVMTDRWNTSQKGVLEIHEANATHVEITMEYFDFAGYQTRNEYMVDNADIVIAVWTGKKGGGTYNCIKYALSKGVPVYNLWPLDGKLHPIKEIA